MNITFRETLPSAVLCIGVALITFAVNATEGWAVFVLAVSGGACIAAWDAAPWGLSAELSRVCRRLDMKQVDFYYNGATDNVVMVILTADDHIHDQVKVTINN